MRDIEYEAPQSLSAAVELMAKQNGRARALAGGTDLIDHVRMGRLEPDVIVDIKKIPELNVLELGSNGLKLGAAVPCYKVYGSEQLTQQYSALADSCRIIGGVQIQSRASVGGNMCNSGPAADSTPSVIARAYSTTAAIATSSTNSGGPSTQAIRPRVPIRQNVNARRSYFSGPLSVRLGYDHGPTSPS